MDIKSFITMGPGPNVIKLFNSSLTMKTIRLDNLSLESLFSLVLLIQIKQEPAQVKYFSGSLLCGRLLALLANNNRLVWKGLPGTNPLAFLFSASVRN